MSPVTRKQQVEEELPVKRSGGRLWLDPRKLEDLADPADQYYVILDLVNGFLQRSRLKRGRTALSFSRVQPDVFQHMQPNFPALLSRVERLSMTRQDLITELELIIEMLYPPSMEGPHVYSVRVVDPANYQLEPVPGDLSYVTQLEVSGGYIYHEILYGLSPEARTKLLQKFLTNAGILEIVLRAPGQPTDKKVLQLVPDGEPVKTSL